MAIRKIVEIDDAKCNGCGLCVDACHEGALKMINGKAKLIKDDYCDGLGDCLPECPTGAISIIEREATDFDKAAVEQRMAAKAGAAPAGGGCPGSMSRTFERNEQTKPGEAGDSTAESQLRQWPVQLRLVNVNAGFLKGADLLIAADCTPMAYAGFHEELLKGRVAIIACPKLDDSQEIVEKLTDIFAVNDIKTVTVARMEVPCCGGITHAVKTAIANSGKNVDYSERIITIDGKSM